MVWSKVKQQIYLAFCDLDERKQTRHVDSACKRLYHLTASESTRSSEYRPGFVTQVQLAVAEMILAEPSMLVLFEVMSNGLHDGAIPVFFR